MRARMHAQARTYERARAHTHTHTHTHTRTHTHTFSLSLSLLVASGSFETFFKSENVIKILRMTIMSGIQARNWLYNICPFHVIKLIASPAKFTISPHAKFTISSRAKFASVLGVCGTAAYVSILPSDGMQASKRDNHDFPFSTLVCSLSVNRILLVNDYFPLHRRLQNSPVFAPALALLAPSLSLCLTHTHTHSCAHAHTYALSFSLVFLGQHWDWLAR